MGGAFREDPDKDWEQVVGAGAITTFLACAAGFVGSGRTAEAWACVGGVIAILIIVAIVTA